MKPVKVFKPNDNTHKAFGDALRKAYESGVRILAYDSIVSPNSIKLDKEVPIEL
jgi:sugar fermentation stimulation protein A